MTMPEAVHRAERGPDSDRWRTPPSLLAEAAELWGVSEWDLDLAADTDAHVAPRWWGPDHPDPRARDFDQAAAEHLAVLAGWRAWANPPYSRWGRWAELLTTATAGGGVAVLAIFARTDTVAWHDHVVGRATAVAFRRGRVRFGDPTGAASTAAPAPTALVLYGGTWSQWGQVPAARASYWVVPGGGA